MSLFETKEQVDAMRAANIPLEGSFFWGGKKLFIEGLIHRASAC